MLIFIISAAIRTAVLISSSEAPSLLSSAMWYGIQYWHLIAAAIKCQYCIPYHIAELKRLGASEEEIKTAVLIAADIMKMSTLFYGNEFDLQAFKKMLKGE